jgi:hypothetical protein
MKRKPTIATVARRAGVAESTVSRYLNSGYVSEGVELYSLSHGSEPQHGTEGLHWRCRGVQPGSVVHAAFSRDRGGVVEAAFERNAG